MIIYEYDTSRFLIVLGSIFFVVLISVIFLFAIVFLLAPAVRDIVDYKSQKAKLDIKKTVISIAVVMMSLLLVIMVLPSDIKDVCAEIKLINRQKNQDYAVVSGELNIVEVYHETSKSSYIYYLCINISGKILHMEQIDEDEYEKIARYQNQEVSVGYLDCPKEDLLDENGNLLWTCDTIILCIESENAIK